MENSSAGVENSIMSPLIPITQLQQLAVKPAWVFWVLFSHLGYLIRR